MNQPKPQWNLAFFIVPPILATLGFLHFFPNYLFPLLLITCVLTIGKKTIALFQSHTLFPQTEIHNVWSRIKNFISLFNLLFLFGLGLMSLIFLTATTQLEPNELGFENIANLWKLIFPLSIGLVAAHMIAQTRIPHSQNISLSSQRKLGSSKAPLDASLRWHDSIKTKTLLTTQILLNFSSFVALLIGLAVVIFSIASALTRSLGADVFNGLQIQTMIASTVLMAPYLSKRWTQQWKKKQSTKNKPLNRRFKILSSSLLLILLITILSLITMPLLADKAINISLFSYLIQPGKTILYWKLLIVAWGLAFAPLLAEQIDQHRQNIISLLLATACVYWLSTAFLETGGKDYFLTIIRQGIPALILTALPLLGLTLNSIKYLKNTYTPTKHERKQEQDSQTLTQTLAQGLTFACVLYWTTSFSLLFPMLLMLVIPSLLLFLLV